MTGKRTFQADAFTLVEVLVTVMIVGVVLVGTLQLFIQSSALAETGGNVTFAMNAAERKMEEIRGHEFDDVVTDYSSSGTPGDTFTFTDPQGAGVIYIDATNPDLLRIDIVVSWQGEDGRIIGEDQDLDGVLDGGEDANGNGRLDSLVTLSTLIADRN